MKLSGKSKSQRSECKYSKTLNELKNIKYALDQSAIVAITNKEGVIQYVNRKFIEMSKFTAKELLGKTHRIINSNFHPKEFFTDLWQTILSGKVWSGDIRNKTKDGRYFWTSTTITPLLDEGDRPQQFIAILDDITKRKELEGQKDEFISIASHELKTPVTSIKAYGQVLQHYFRKRADKNAVKLLVKMDKQIDKLTDLIMDMLDATKIESGKLTLNKSRFDFNDLTSEIIENLQLTTGKHEILLNGKVNQPVYGDRERIGQVMTNLLSNAIKYSPHSNKIVTYAEKENSQVRFSVRDFGIGIPEEKQQKIFERFYRVTGQKQETYPGLGLGLYISAEIIRRHGGMIGVESKEGKGSIFYFTLPYNKNNKK